MGTRGLGAAPAAGIGNAICLQWTQTNYHFAEFDKASAALLAWSRSAPTPPWTNGLGQPVSPPGDLMQSATAWKDEAWRTWKAYCADAATFAVDASRRLRDLAAMINLPMCWLFASDPKSVAANNEVVAPASWDFYGLVDTTIPVTLVGKETRSWVQPEKEIGQQAVKRLSENVTHSRLNVSILDGSVDVPHQFRRTAVGLAEFWVHFNYVNKPRGTVPRSGQHPLGYPAGHGPFSIPPAAVTCSKEKSASIFGGGAENRAAQCNVNAGPAVTVAAIQRIVATATSRTGLAVLSNAFQTWGRILTVWVDAPGNHMPADNLGIVRAAGRTMSGTGDAMLSTGVAESNPYTLVAGVALAVVGRLAALVRSAVGSTACYMEGGTYRILWWGDKPRPSRFTGGLRNYKSMGNLCAPAQPILVPPPDGCAPGEALAAAPTSKRLTSKRTFPDLGKPKTEWPPWLKWVALGVGGGALAYGGYKLAVGRSANPRRRKRRARRHAGRRSR